MPRVAITIESWTFHAEPGGRPRCRDHSGLAGSDDLQRGTLEVGLPSLKDHGL